MMIINRKNMPKKSQTRFYGFLMTKILPQVLNTFREMTGQEKYFWDKPGQEFLYRWKVNMEWEKADYIKVIIMATIALFQRRNHL
jgi:hypothetical protein